MLTSFVCCQLKMSKVLMFANIQTAGRLVNEAASF